MSKTISISATLRDKVGSADARRYRRAGQVPVCVYSRGEETVSMLVSEADAKKVQHHAGLLSIACDSGEQINVVSKEVQVHPLNNKILHMDFHAVRADEVLVTTVEIVLEGEPAGLRQGGQLEQVLRELDVSSLPADIPESIVVDVSALECDQSILVSEIVLPEGVEAVTDGELVVAQVRIPRASVEEEAEATEGEEAEGEDSHGEDSHHDKAHHEE